MGKADILVSSINGIMEYSYWINVDKNIKSNIKNVDDNFKKKYQKEEHNIGLI